VRGLLTVLSVAVVAAPEDEPLSLGPEVRMALLTTRSMVRDGEKKTEPAVLDKADLTRVMKRFHGKVAAAARELGITRPKLYRLLWAQDIDPALFRVA
jgi:transcriptional regulator of acetoin/glycerol metabolism